MVLKLSELSLGGCYQVTITNKKISSGYQNQSQFTINYKNNTYIGFTLSGMSKVFYSGDHLTLSGSLARYGKSALDTDLSKYHLKVTINSQPSSSITTNDSVSSDGKNLDITLSGLPTQTNNNQIVLGVTYEYKNDQKTVPIDLIYETESKRDSFYCPSPSTVASSSSSSDTYLSALPPSQPPLEYETALGTPSQNWAIKLRPWSAEENAVIRTEPKASIDKSSHTALCTYVTTTGTITLKTQGAWKNLSNAQPCNVKGSKFINCLLAN